MCPAHEENVMHDQTYTQKMALNNKNKWNLSISHFIVLKNARFTWLVSYFDQSSLNC